MPNISNMTHSSDNSNITHTKPCTVLLKDILDLDNSEQHWCISKCEAKGS